MHNAADDPAIIDARFPASVGRQMRCKPRELMIVQPEMISIHCRSPFGDLESENARVGNPVYGSAPNTLETIGTLTIALSNDIHICCMRQRGTPVRNFGWRVRLAAGLATRPTG